MENPFPGMDPWMEQQWGDAHARLIVYACDQIVARLPADLKARVEERVYVASGRERLGTRQPDLRVTTRRRSAAATVGGDVADPDDAGGATGTATAVQRITVVQPRRVMMPSESVTEGFIEIRERLPSGRLITVIEVLSPENKRGGRGRREYLAKQRECLRAGINLVEIDLLRRGRWTVVAPPEFIDDPGTFRISAWSVGDPNVADFYPIGLREALPAIALPLRPGDFLVPLELQPLVNQAYRNGDYADTDYARDPDPPLEGDDAQWADELLRGKKLRA